MDRRRKLAALVCGLLITLYAGLGFAQEVGEGPEPTAVTETDGGGFGEQLRAFWASDGVAIAKQIGLAIGLFLVGWIIAKLFAWAVYRLLLKTSIDDKLAEKLGLGLLAEEGDKSDDRIERISARILYYLLMLLVVVGVLQYSGLSQAAVPIQSFVNRIAESLPLIGKAVLILLISYLAGLILQKVATRALNKARLDDRFAEMSGEKRPAEGDEAEAEAEAARPFSEGVGRVIFWLVMVAGLAGAVDALEIGPLAHSMQNAVDRIVALLPSLAIAAALLLAGYVLGRIARTVVDNLLDGVGFNRLVARIKLDTLFGEWRASDVLGLVAMIFIILQAAIAALDELGLETLAAPLTDMMERFWLLLPPLTVSLIIVAAGIIGGKLLRNLAESALSNIGFDEAMERLGFGALEEKTQRPSRPHQVVGLVVQIGVILVATVQALDSLSLETWAAYVNAFIRYSVTHAAVALLIVAVGLAVGNYVRDLILMRREDEGDEIVGYVASFARYAVIVFAFTMAIHHLDVGPNFVLITFSLLFGSLCLALALALGLGSREVAGDIVKRQYDRARGELEARSKKRESE